MQAVAGANVRRMKRRNWRKTIGWAVLGLVPGAVVGGLLGPWFLNAGLVIVLGYRLPFALVPPMMALGALLGALGCAGYWGWAEGDTRSQAERDRAARKAADRERRAVEAQEPR